MGIRLNLFCNKQIAANDVYLKRFDLINWGPGHIERDEFGIPISNIQEGSESQQEDPNHADLQE